MKYSYYWFPLKTKGDRMFITLSQDPSSKPFAALMVTQDQLNGLRRGRDLMSLMIEDSYTNGRWIPDSDYINRNKSNFELFRRVFSCVNPDNKERIPETIERIVGNTILHAMTQGARQRIFDASSGPSNYVEGTLALSIGNCLEKCTIVKGLLDYFEITSQIVGYNSFDKAAWREICQRFPPLDLKQTRGRVPMMYSFVQETESVERDGFIAYDPNSSGGILRLNPDKPPIGPHFFVKTCDANLPNVDPVTDLTLFDPSYKILRDYREKMAFPCLIEKICQQK